MFYPDFFFIFQIVFERVNSHLSLSGAVWNNFPGALAVHSDYTQNLEQMPFYNLEMGEHIWMRIQMVFGFETFK